MNAGIAQPGCFTPICAHSRAIEYFTEALNPKHRFIGERCKSVAEKLLSELIAESCSDVEDRLGIYSSRKNGIFFVETNSEPPYAQSIRKNDGK